MWHEYQEKAARLDADEDARRRKVPAGEGAGRPEQAPYYMQKRELSEHRGVLGVLNGHLLDPGGDLYQGL